MTALSCWRQDCRFRSGCLEGEINDVEIAWLKRKFAQYGIKPKKDVASFTKIVAGKKLWSYDKLEPAEKKLIL